MKKLGNREKEILKYFIIFAGIAAISQYFFIQPARRQLSLEKEELQKVNEEIQQAYEFLRDLNRIRDEADKMETQWQYFKNKLPDSKQIPSLLAALANAAGQAHLTYVSINTKALEKGESRSSLLYNKLPIEIKLRCRYRNLGEYLANLRKLPRLVKVESLRISRQEEIAPDIEAVLEVYTYVLNSEGQGNELIQ